MTAASGLAARRGGVTAGMRALHRATASLLVGSHASTWAISSATSSVGASRLTLLHRSFGVAIRTLTAIRLAWRQSTRAPELPLDVPRPQRLAARANLMGLYVLLVVQPMPGLTAGMLHVDRLVLLGGLALPGILPVDRKLSHVAFGMHGTLALLLLGLIGMHAAAFYHHFVRRDDVVAGMLPGLKRRRYAIPRQLTSRR